MGEFLELASVFGVAFLSFWAAFPTGLALGLHPAVIAVVACVSYVCGLTLVIVVGQRLRAWLMQRFGDRLTGDPNSAVRRAWDRFGIIGLGLLAPMVTGSQIGAAVGLALNAEPRRLMLWMTLGAIVWGIALAVAASLGLAGLEAAGG